MTRVTRRRRPAAPALPPRARQKLDTRERIRAAAWALFTTVGYEATTTKAVAARAGVAAGTVFVHASDKADLLFLVMHDRLAAAIDAQLATLPRAGLVDQLLHVFGGILRMYEAHRGVAVAFVKALPGATQGPNGQKVDALTFAFLHRLAGLVRDAQARGEVARDVDPDQAARNLFALYLFSLTVWVSGYVSLEAALDGLRSAFELQRRGLARGVA